jgi:hypothetical protein
LDTASDAALRVQLAADKIARAEQATIYQQRLERMDTAINQIEREFAQHIRDLAGAE